MKTIAKKGNGNGMKSIHATALRLKTREVLKQVRWQGATYQVTTFGTPVAVTPASAITAGADVLPVAEYERLIGAMGIPVALPPRS